MDLSDKARNMAQTVGGKAKQVLGDAANDDNIRAEGKADQVVAHAVRHNQIPTDADLKHVPLSDDPKSRDSAAHRDLNEPDDE